MFSVAHHLRSASRLLLCCCYGCCCSCVRRAFTAAASERDPATLSRLHRHANELLALLISNMEHSRYLLEGGWGIRRDNARTLSNVAHKVGLQMPKMDGHQHEQHEPAGNKHHKARDAKLTQHDKFVK